MSDGARRLLQLLGPFIGLFLVLGVFGALAPEGFLSFENFQVVMTQMVIVGLCAIGMTFVIVSGGIDLSVGSMIALCSVVVAILLRDGYDPSIALVGGVLTGAVCGLVNGLLITTLRIVPFVATLGMFGMARGAAKFLADNQKVDAPRSWIDGLNTMPESWPGFSPSVWLLLVLGLLTTLVLRQSVFGTHTFAIGSNEATARLCGVPVARTKVAIYTLCGFFCGLAGVVQFSRIISGNPTAAMGKELDVIAAVVIGGGSLAGGEGRIYGSLIGALLMAYLANGCTFCDIPNYVKDIIIGAIIVAAVALDQLRRRRG